MKQLVSILLTATALSTSAQLPDTDIFLSEIKTEGNHLTFSEPVNKTKRKGYDNQPCFTADGTAFYFTAINKDTTQSDLYKADLVKRSIERVTRTAASEYSPVISPSGKSISVVRVDADSGQRFYLIPIDDPRVSIHIDHSDSIGYYAWTSDTSIAMFVLGGNHPTLELLDIKSGERRKVATDIGRCLKTDKARRFLFFTDKSDSAVTFIKRMDLSSGEIVDAATAISGSEDYEVLQDGSLLMGNKGKLYRLSPGAGQWEMVADFTAVLHDFYRIVADPTGRLLALVAYTGEKP